MRALYDKTFEIGCFGHGAVDRVVHALPARKDEPWVYVLLGAGRGSNPAQIIA